MIVLLNFLHSDMTRVTGVGISTVYLDLIISNFLSSALPSGANSVEDIDGSHHGGVREQLVWSRPSVRAGAELGDAVAGFLAQAR